MAWMKKCTVTIFDGSKLRMNILTNFDYWGYPGQGRWKIYGMELPDPVLERIYHLNAERIFRQFKLGADLPKVAK